MKCKCVFCSVCPFFVNFVIVGRLFVCSISLSVVGYVFRSTVFSRCLLSLLFFVCCLSLSSVHSVCLSTIHLFGLSVYVSVCLYICCSVCCLVVLFRCLCFFVCLSDWLLHVSSLWLSNVYLFVCSVYLSAVCCLFVFCCLFILFDLSVISFIYLFGLFFCLLGVYVLCIYTYNKVL